MDRWLGRASGVCVDWVAQAAGLIPVGIDRNLLVGVVVAVALAAAVAGWVGQLPVQAWVDLAAEKPERASSAWAEPRDLLWVPRAPVVPSTTQPPPSPAAGAPAPLPAATPKVAHAAAAKPALAPEAPANGAVAVPPSTPGVQPTSAMPAALGSGAPAAGPADAVGTGLAGSAGDDAGADSVLAVANVDTPPQPVDTPQPPFPAVAERLGLSAQVRVSCVIETTGRVSHITIQCEPDAAPCHPTFLAATRTAVQRWVFSPARLHGAPVRVKVSQLIRFDPDEL